MSEKLQPVRGTQDILFDGSQRFRHIDGVAFSTAQLFGYGEMTTPIFEFSQVFHRTLGETSDAVTKETYTFKDRGGEELTLRPEGTAGIARAFISNGLTQNLPLKIYYVGPMFRYERPQKGRYRQFHQIGVESLGPDTPNSDVECIALAHTILENLGLRKFTTLELNSLGDAESRQNHRAALVDYLAKFKNELSEDSKVRLEKNPLRILDSKDPGDQKILQSAPPLGQFLNEKSRDFFSRVQNGLKNLNIEFKINEKLVRGLDYYTHTVFEFTTSELGAQSAVLAGGRYDGLIESMGGPATPGVGWASGMERLSLLLEKEWRPESRAVVAVLPGDLNAEAIAEKLTMELRKSGLTCENLEVGNIGKKMKRANKIGAKVAIIIGETEVQQNSAAVKDLTSGEQKLVPMIDVPKAVKLILAATK